jgi:hypothetical protein
VDSNLLVKLFGSDAKWQGPCTVLLDSNASVRSAGPDSIVAGGAKSYAPRISSGRIVADAVCLMREHSALLIVQRTIVRHHTGEERTQQCLLVIDTAHITGVEFETLSALESLGIRAPEIPARTTFAPGTLVG